MCLSHYVSPGLARIPCAVPPCWHRIPQLYAHGSQPAFDPPPSSCDTGIATLGTLSDPPGNLRSHNPCQYKREHLLSRTLTAGSALQAPQNTSFRFPMHSPLRPPAHLSGNAAQALHQHLRRTVARRVAPHRPLILAAPAAHGKRAEKRQDGHQRKQAARDPGHYPLHRPPVLHLRARPHRTISTIWHVYRCSCLQQKSDHLQPAQALPACGRCMQTHFMLYNQSD